MPSWQTVLAVNICRRKNRDFSRLHPKKRDSKSPLNIKTARRLTISGQQSASASGLFALDMSMLAMT
jgi:hypothetical protein